VNSEVKHIGEEDLLVSIQNLKGFGHGHAVDNAGRQNGVGGRLVVDILWQAHLVFGRDSLARFQVTPTVSQLTYAY
jgi:hypothetical protein